MTSPERPPAPAYLRVARFTGETPAGRAYRRAQDLLVGAPACELSAFRFHLDRIWHVAVLGDQPPEDLEGRLRVVLSRGEPAILPEDILLQLQRRRARATRVGPWVEGHYRPGERFPT